MFYSRLILHAIRLWRDGRAVEGACLESMCTFNDVPRVRIPLSPPDVNTCVMVASIGLFATICCEPRQVRKEATVMTDSGAEVRLILAASLEPVLRKIL